MGHNNIGEGMLIIIFRTIVLYLVTITAMRIMGKRQIGQLEPNELVVMVMISEIAALPMQDIEIPMVHGIVPILILVSTELLISFLLLKSIKLRKIVSGVPTMLINDGLIQRDELKKNRLTVDELIEEIRIRGTTDLSQVKYAILETNGILSVTLYPKFQPATAQDVGAIKQDSGMPVVVINDGRWLDKNLQIQGYERKYVEKDLVTKGLTPEKCLLVMLDENGGIYAAKK